jgi:hypothetical protein
MIAVEARSDVVASEIFWQNLFGFIIKPVAVFRAKINRRTIGFHKK